MLQGFWVFRSLGLKGFRVSGLGVVRYLGFEVEGLSFSVWGLGF